MNAFKYSLTISMLLLVSLAFGCGDDDTVTPDDLKASKARVPDPRRTRRR